MMLAKIAPSINEVMMVKGCPLEENELWAIFRKIIFGLHSSEGEFYILNQLTLFLFCNKHIFTLYVRALN